ncbi:MAG: hypothetical protein ACJ8HJ_06240 [Massilia sp.]
MLTVLPLVESNMAFQITILLAGVATFCAAVLSRANPLCIWLEWVGVCSDDGDDQPNRAHVNHEE